MTTPKGCNSVDPAGRRRADIEERTSLIGTACANSREINVATDRVVLGTDGNGTTLWQDIRRRTLLMPSSCSGVRAPGVGVRLNGVVDCLHLPIRQSGNRRLGSSTRQGQSRQSGGAVTFRRHLLLFQGLNARQRIEIRA